MKYTILALVGIPLLILLYRLIYLLLKDSFNNKSWNSQTTSRAVLMKSVVWKITAYVFLIAPMDALTHILMKSLVLLIGQLQNNVTNLVVVFSTVSLTFICEAFFYTTIWIYNLRASVFNSPRNPNRFISEFCFVIL